MLPIKILKHVNNIRNYSRRFGWPAGLDIARAVDYQRPDQTARIRLGAGCVSLRSGTSDVDLFEDVFVHEQYRNDWNVTPRFILDCGAHIGLASIYFARKYPDANILAVEATQKNFDLLVRNTAPYSRITPRNAAVWHTPEFVSIENPSDDAWAFRCAANHNGSNDVQGLTIPQLAEGRRIDILKMDIEGAEKMIFSAADTSWLDAVGVLMIEFHDRFTPGCAEAVYRALRPGFNQVIAGETTSIKLR